MGCDKCGYSYSTVDHGPVEAVTIKTKVNELILRLCERHRNSLVALVIDHFINDWGWDEKKLESYEREKVNV